MIGEQKPDMGSPKTPEKKESSTKTVNDYLKSYVEKHGNVALAKNVIDDIFEYTEGHDYNLTWPQIDLLEKTLGDLQVKRFHKEETRIDLMVIVTFIITCGTANAVEKQ